MNIKPITLQDAEEAYDIVKDNGNSSRGDETYTKELYRFDDGKALFFCAGTLYDGDSFDHYCRLGIENPNAVLTDFEFDYVMPWNPNNEYGDVVDTEISLPITQSDVDWLNKEANDIVKGYESGELVASSRKTGKKPVKSSEDKEKYWGAFGENGCVDFLTREEFIEKFGEEPKDEDALDYVDSGCHGKTKKKSKKPVKSSMPGRERGIQAIMDEYGCTREEAIEIMNEEIQNSRRPVESGLYDEANAFDPKDYDFDKVYDFIYNKYSERIDRELDDLLYAIQQELGITTGDTLLDKEDCVNKLVAILADQFGNRS